MALPLPQASTAPATCPLSLRFLQCKKRTQRRHPAPNGSTEGHFMGTPTPVLPTELGITGDSVGLATASTQILTD